MAHHGDPIGNIDDFAELMRNENNRLAFFGKAAQDLEQTLGLLGCQNSGRLIHDQQPRTAIERLQDLDALLHADGQIRDTSRWINVEAVSGRQRLDLPPRLLEIHGADRTDRLVAENHVLGNRQWWDQHEMLVHHADAEPDRVRGAMD